MVHFASADLQSALPTWTQAMVAADAKSRGTLSATLEAYANADMNVLRAARHLDVHPNTLYARLQRIKDITGLDGQRFAALNELLLAMECAGG